MRIHKILNNNVVTIVDEATSMEKVIMGRGIAFKKRAGEAIDESKIEKVFLIENRKENIKFQKLIHEIPLEYITISEEIISYAKQQLKASFDDHIYVALTDHVAFAIKRASLGLEIKNHLLWEIQRIYKEEYKVGLWAIDFIEEKLGVKMPEDEAGFIALHLVNASLGKEMGDTMSMTAIVQDILNIIKYHFIVEFDEKDISYDRLVTHLKFFAQRIISKKKFEPGETTPFLELIKKNYRKQYDCALKIKSYIEKNYDYEISEEEIVYLSLHLYRVVSRQNE